MGDPTRGPSIQGPPVQGRRPPLYRRQATSTPTPSLGPSRKPFSALQSNCAAKSGRRRRQVAQRTEPYGDATITIATSRQSPPQEKEDDDENFFSYEQDDDDDDDQRDDDQRDDDQRDDDEMCSFTVIESSALWRRKKFVRSSTRGVHLIQSNEDDNEDNLFGLAFVPTSPVLPFTQG